MKKDTGCLTAIGVSLVLVIAGNLAYRGKTVSTTKASVRTNKLVDSVKIDSVIIKIYKE